MIQVRLEWGDEWAYGKFQDANESVRSGHTEWVCKCLSGHTASFRMPMRVCTVGTQSGYANAWVGRFHGEEASGATRVGTRWVCVYLSGRDPRRGSKWCHVVAAQRLYMYVQWDIQYTGTAERGSRRRASSPQAAVVQAWGALQVWRGGAWYIYTHAAGWQAGEMARELGVTDEQEVRRALLARRKTG